MKQLIIPFNNTLRVKSLIESFSYACDSHTPDVYNWPLPSPMGV